MVSKQTDMSIQPAKTPRAVSVIKLFCIIFPYKVVILCRNLASQIIWSFFPNKPRRPIVTVRAKLFKEFPCTVTGNEIFASGTLESDFRIRDAMSNRKPVQIID